MSGQNEEENDKVLTLLQIRNGAFWYALTKHTKLCWGKNFKLNFSLITKTWVDG